jgi:hypothetical protein
VSDVFEVARALPFVRIVTVVPRLRSVLSTVGGIIALVARFAVVYCGISYAFAIVGMAIFGGVSQADNNGFCQNCQMWTLESFSKTWLALLQLTVGNNWNSILYPNVRGGGVAGGGAVACCTTSTPLPLSLAHHHVQLKGIGSRWGALFFVAYRCVAPSHRLTSRVPSPPRLPRAIASRVPSPPECRHTASPPACPRAAACRVPTLPPPPRARGAASS